ncbi:MAG: RNA polymerase sigma factor [Planctomycetes bacterium]|nr:RNA polymerase sigma factor [Planctomycetota bacterium]
MAGSTGDRSSPAPRPTCGSQTQQAGARLAALMPRLRWLALHAAGRALRRRLDVEDLLQEACLRAWQARDRWPAPSAIPEAGGPGATDPGKGAARHGQEPAALGEDEFARWLSAVVRHTAVDAARAARARKRSGGEARLERTDFTRGGEGGEWAADTGGPATRAVRSEQRVLLERSFTELSGEHRRVLALRQFEGLSAAAAAARLGRSETAVHSLYRRALQAWQAGLDGKISLSDDESSGVRRSGSL